METAFVTSLLGGKVFGSWKFQGHLARENAVRHFIRYRTPRYQTPRCAAGDDEGDINKSESSFSSMAAGPQTTRKLPRLGRKRKPEPFPRITRKTAADFAAEGIKDDVKDGQRLEATDIRYGIADLEDPFKKDADISELERLKAGLDLDKEAQGQAQALDVTGDGSVAKTILSVGSGDVVKNGATVSVKYTGSLEDGTVFDTTDERNEPFTFVLGRGSVIKGWEAGIATMKLGEVAILDIKPAYAYGRRGMPPVIPGNSKLTFKVEVVNVEGGDSNVIKKVRDFNPNVARTPEAIAREYDELLATQKERNAKRSLLERFYIISPFASQTGEAPPWWLNPNITFIGVFGLVAIAFYLVYISGAIHVGYVQDTVDVNIFK